MTIRYDENGNPYDDGVYDYEAAAATQAPQEPEPIVVYQQEDTSQNISPVIVDQPENFDTDNGFSPPQDNPEILNKYNGSITDDFSGTSSIPMSFDLPDQSLVTDTPDYYSNEPIDLDGYDYGFGNDYSAEPVAPSSGETTTSTSNFENARRTPLRGGQDGSVRTPVRDFLFGRKGRFSEQPSVYTEPTPSVDVAADSSPISIQNANALAAADMSGYDYNLASKQDELPEPSSNPVVKISDGVVKMPAGDFNYNAPKIYFEGINDPKRIEFGDKPPQLIGQSSGMIDKFGIDLPYKNSPLDRTPEGMAIIPKEHKFKGDYDPKYGNVFDPLVFPEMEKIIIKDRDNKSWGGDFDLRNNGTVPNIQSYYRNMERLGFKPNEMRTVYPEGQPLPPKQIDLPQFDPKWDGSVKVTKPDGSVFKFNSSNELVPDAKPSSVPAPVSSPVSAPVNPLAPAESVEQRIRREMQAQFAKDNQQRKDLNLIEQSRVAVPLGEKGIPDSEVQAAKNRVSAYYAEQNAKKEKEIDDEIKANQERQILDAIEAEKNKNKKPNNAEKALPVAPLPVAPAPVPKSSNAAEVDRPQSKGTFEVLDESSEQMEGETFFSKGPNGLTPQFIPLASNVLDKETAEKNINKLQQLKQDELNRASPSGDLLKSQLRKEVALKKLGDDSLQRIYDYVTEVNNTMALNTHIDKASGSSRGNTVTTEGGSSITAKNEFGSSGSSSNYKQGASSEINEKESSGKSKSETVVNNKRINNSDNRMNVISLASKLEESIAETILKRASEARSKISAKYDPFIERYTDRYKQLNSQADSNSARETFLGDLTGTGKTYPSLAFSASSPQPASNIDHFSKRFDTTDPALKRQMDDISVKIGLLNRGDEAVMKDVPVNELSNPKIKNILDGNFNNKIISNIIKGSNPDVEFEMAKGLHSGERILREQTIGGPEDPSDPVSVALNQAQLKAAGTNTDFGQAVLAAKVLKAHNDLTNMFTMPSPNPADAKGSSKRVLVPFNKFIENVYQNVSADPSKNALLGAVAVELANKFPAYKQELNNLENARRSYIFSDPEKEALSNMVRFLADPVNGKYYQSKIKGYNFNKFNQQSLPLQPTMLGH